MLQIDDGLLIFPVGLDNQALDGATDHAEGTGLLLDNTEPLLALQAATLPLLIAQIDRLIRDRQLSAELSHLLAHGKHQRVETGTRHSGHGKEHMAIVERRTLKVGNLVGRARRIALVGDNDLRTLRKLGTILLELTVDDAIVLNRITILKPARHVNDMHDQGRALNVAQELMAQATTLARALDETGNVGNDVRIFAGTHHAQIGHKRGKRVVGNLGTGSAHTRDERGLADRGKAHKRSIGHELHLELDPVLLSRLAELGKRGRATHRRHKVSVAQTASTTGRHDNALAVVHQVGNLEHRGLRLGIELADYGAHGDFQNQVLTAFAVAAGTLAMRSALGTEVMLKAVIDQRGQLSVGLNDDVAATTAVAAIGAALGNKCLAPKRHASGSAVAAANVNSADIGEL